jgi:hypothetical protein
LVHAFNTPVRADPVYCGLFSRLQAVLSMETFMETGVETGARFVKTGQQGNSK